MKRPTPALLGLGAIATGCLAVVAWGEITGSAHDFTPYGWSQGEICLPCHVPHNAMHLTGGQFDVGERAPLWNHEVTTATYTIYDGTTGVPTHDALDSRSILCMSCHDGTVALDSFGGNIGNQFIGPNGLIGTDISDDHPVGVTAIYPDEPWFNDPANWEDDPHGFHLQDMDVDGTIERVVGCTTCHEPHNRENIDHMLWINNAGSALCLTCHLK
jgi:predicted CXXCH cytochrome family protein